MDKNKPIGIFDSGVGGLTVVAEVFRQLPDENVVYFGDVGRTPYGNRSKDIILQFTRQDVAFLRDQDVKFIVAACNTASAACCRKSLLRSSFSSSMFEMNAVSTKTEGIYTRLSTTNPA